LPTETNGLAGRVFHHSPSMMRVSGGRSFAQVRTKSVSKKRARTVAADAPRTVWVDG